MSYFEYNGKKVYYKEIGKGRPLIIIHGNSVSSNMHSKFAKKLRKFFKVISIDLPGHGKSERIDEWPIDFWYEHSKVIYSLIKYLEINDVVLLGYSGGAQIAINTALEYPKSISKVIADSFEGDQSVSEFADKIFEDRKKDKKHPMAKLFWFFMHGFDWSKVVDNDSNIIYNHHHTIGCFFHKDLSEFQVPLYLTGSKNDEYIKNFDEIYNYIQKKTPHSQIKIFDTGKHPASLTVGDDYIDGIIKFIGGK